MAHSEKREYCNMIEDTANRFMSDNYTFDKRKILIQQEPGFASDQWHAMVELGWMQLPISEQFDGLGGDAELVATLFRQFGKHLYQSPYFASAVVSARLLEIMVDDPLRTDLLKQIGEGLSVVSPAIYERQSRYDLGNIATTAVKNDGSYRLNGTKIAVQYGNMATQLLVLARTHGEQTESFGVSMYLVPANSSGVTFEHHLTHDGGRISTLHLDNVSVEADRLIGEEHNALPMLQRALNYGVAMVCAEMTGVMDALLEQTLEFVKIRQQFGSTIGSFQAIQHRLVDMYMRCELANSMSLEASRAVNELDQPEQDRLVSAAKAEIGRAAMLNAEEAVHLHGAMGMMNDMPVGHFLKRMLTLNLLYGDVDYHQNRYRELVANNNAPSS